MTTKKKKKRTQGVHANSGTRRKPLLAQFLSHNDAAAEAAEDHDSLRPGRFPHHSPFP